jgi:hypothetical protein
MLRLRIENPFLVTVAVSSFLFFISTFAMNAIFFQPSQQTVLNASTMTSPAPSIDVSWLQSLLPAIPWIAYALRELLKWLRDRNWKKKYDDVVVAKPL